MKKIAKRVVSVFLAVILVLSTASVAFAKESVTPVILVHGLGATAVYDNPNTENETEIANMGLGDTKAIITGLLSKPTLIYKVLDMFEPSRKLKADELIAELAGFVAETNINCDKNGNVRAGQGVNSYWTDSMANHKDYYTSSDNNERGIVHQLVDTVGAKNVYVFNYDWRQDICKTATELNSYIKLVKKNTGAKKVSVVGCSLGGSVLAAYIDAYKNNKDLDRCVFVEAAFQGVDVAGIYAKDLAITRSAVDKYINSLKPVLYAGQYSTLIQIAYAVADVRIGYAADYLNKFLKNEKNVDKFLLEVIKPWIGNIPSLWECIPYGTFNSAVKEMSAIGFLDKSGGLYKKIKKYHSVQGRLKSNLSAIKKQGVQVAIIAAYGTKAIPVTGNYKNQTDILIDTKYAGAGATVADYGSSIKRTGKYVSKDGVIDAGTCYLKDNTWFFKNIQHMAFSYNTQATKLLANIVCGKVNANVSAVKKKYKYGQFIICDQAQNLKNVK